MTRLALSLLVACAPTPKVAEPVRAEARHCFFALAKFEGREQVARGCFQTAALCGNAQRRTVRWGGMAGVVSVGRCERI